MLNPRVSCRRLPSRLRRGSGVTLPSPGRRCEVNRSDDNHGHEVGRFSFPFRATSSHLFFFQIPQLGYGVGVAFRSQSSPSNDLWRCVSGNEEKRFRGWDPLADGHRKRSASLHIAFILSEKKNLERSCRPLPSYQRFNFG